MHLHLFSQETFIESYKYSRSANVLGTQFFQRLSYDGRRERTRKRFTSQGKDSYRKVLNMLCGRVVPNRKDEVKDTPGRALQEGAVSGEFRLEGSRDSQPEIEEN